MAAHDRESLPSALEPGSPPVNPQIQREDNAAIAGRLDELAQMLAEQNANRFRVESYRRAARTVREASSSIRDLAVDRGITALTELPGIGESIARTIYQLATSGRSSMLERLRGECDPVEILSSVPGIGSKTAQRLHDELGIQTLEELEAAAHDGRLQRLHMGDKRIFGIRDALAGRLGRAGRRTVTEHEPLPSVSELLDVDREYREQAAKGALPTIAPRRFNPTHEAWLPVLHTRRGERHYTALYSNTARAHELRRTRDWVVLYFDGRGTERQCTVITSGHGVLRGRRIVAGREPECLQHYGRAKLPGARRTGATHADAT
jgi:hypothetical protein